MSTLTTFVLLASLLGTVLLLIYLMTQGVSWRRAQAQAGGGYHLADLERLYEAKPRKDAQLSGGLLVHTMLLSDVERWLKQEPFAIQGNDLAICDCSYPSEELGGSCSAWTLLRSDLLPTIFSSPTSSTSSPNASAPTGIAEKLASTPCIGIIIDPSMAWSLISSMAVIDAATDERNCGQISYPGSSIQKTIETVCAASDRGFGQSGTVVFHNPLLASDLCRKDCTMDDQYCKLQNAGGTIALSSLGKSPRGNWGCSDCSGPFPPSGVEGQMQGCSQSSMPFVCRLQSSVRDEDLVDGHAWAPYGKSEGYAFAAIGETGAGMQALFQTSEGRLSDAWTVGGNQCKFLRENWAVWIRSIQRFYRTVFEAYDASTKVLSAEFDSTIGGNYLMSCPGYGYNFFENEVNLYFNRKSSEPEFQRLAEQQSEVLRRSIVGFYVTGLTCEEQLRSLEGIPCSVGAKTFAGARDRCLGYFADGEEGAYDRFRALEREHMRRSKELVKRLVERFNATYRASETKRKVQAYRFVGSNSTFFNLGQLSELVQKRRIPFEQVFQPL